MPSAAELTPKQNEQVRDLIRKIIAQAGSQGKAAKALGVTQASLSALLRGKTGASLDLARRAAEYAQIPPGRVLMSEREHQTITIDWSHIVDLVEFAENVAKFAERDALAPDVQRRTLSQDVSTLQGIARLLRNTFLYTVIRQWFLMEAWIPELPAPDVVSQGAAMGWQTISAESIMRALSERTGPSPAIPTRLWTPVRDALGRLSSAARAVATRAQQLDSSTDWTLQTEVAKEVADFFALMEPLLGP